MIKSEWKAEKYAVTKRHAVFQNIEKLHGSELENGWREKKKQYRMMSKIDWMPDTLVFGYMAMASFETFFRP